MNRTFLRAALALAIAGCNGDNLPGDASMVDGPQGRDATVSDAPTRAADARSDGPIDAATDGPLDAAPDAPLDAAPDAPLDAAPDAPLDAPVDAAPDAALDAAVFEEPIYDFLSETGLYDDIENKVLVSGLIEFEPEFKLWSDGAGKRRWVQLPPGQTIDSSDMDHWQFPVGTKVWKEFSHQVSGNTVLLETRLTEIWGPDQGQVYQAAFVWNADDTDAAFALFGATNIKGTDHDAPAQDQCIRCHRGEESLVLGFQAVQLSHMGTPNIDTIAADGLLSDMPTPGGYPVPGNAVERAAVGYLHANCGHCHNDSNNRVAVSACFALPQLQLWVKTTDEMIFDTYAYLHNVDQDLVFWVSPAEGNVEGYTKRIVRGNPDESALYYRMAAREAGQAPPLDDQQQMPPFATDLADPTGLAAVEAWILSL